MDRDAVSSGRKRLKRGGIRLTNRCLRENAPFSIDRGAKPPFETYNDATRELQGILQTCVQDDKSSRAQGNLWSLSTVAVDQWIVSRDTLMESAAVRQIVNNAFTAGLGLAS